ncbi:MAG TPA: YceI family protein [Burkholderiales bacterium]|nr:YceI family protein [Burkholderiales bacterium]
MPGSAIRSAFPGVVFALAVAALSSAASAAEQFKIDPNHTFVYFAVVHTGVSSVRGRFAITKGSASLDAAQQLATFTVEIDARSLDTGVKQLDGILVGETFFDVAKFRTATFSGRAVRFADGVPAEFEGDLTVKGVTRPVHLTAERFVCQEVTVLVIKHFVCGGDLTADLKRSDFGLTKYLTMVSDDVRITISVEAIRESK